MTERMLLKDYKYCPVPIDLAQESPFRGESCQYDKLCMCAQVYEIRCENILRAKYGYLKHEWFDWEPLPEPPQ